MLLVVMRLITLVGSPFPLTWCSNQLTSPVHLGDYIYEYQAGVVGRDARASNPPHEIFTLYDYRTRIAQYRTDSDLSLAHQNFAWITTWDDHEISNNGYRDGSSGLNNTESSFIRDGRVSVDQRKMNAVRAYFEWMPIRQVNLDDNLRIWRNFQMGKLFDLVVLDTRNYDRSITDLNWNTDYVTSIRNDAGRSLMGSNQENWFYRTLSESKERGATWRIVGNQIVFSRVNITSWFGSAEEPYNVDQWDGYTADRRRVFTHIRDRGVKDALFVTGDIHSGWACELPYDASTYPLGDSAGVEFVCSSVTSNNLKDITGSPPRTTSVAVEEGIKANNRHVKYLNFDDHGFSVLDITAKRAQMDWYVVEDRSDRRTAISHTASYATAVGTNTVVRVERPVG